MERNHSIFNRVTASVLAFVMTLSMALPSMQIAYAADISDGQKYSVKIEESEHGKIIFSNTDEDSKDFSPGDTVTLNAAPDDGYALDALDVLISQDIEEDDLNFSNEDDEYTFTMPESDVTVAATFAPTGAESSSAEEDTTETEEEVLETEDVEDYDATETVMEEETSEAETEDVELGDDEYGLTVLSVEEDEDGELEEMEFIDDSGIISEDYGINTLASSETHTVTIGRAQRYRYSDYGVGSYSTSKYTVSASFDGDDISGYAYCLQPSYGAPTGTKTATITKYSDSKDLSKVLYYGTQDLSGSDSYWTNTNDSNDDGWRWICVHTAAAKVYGKDSEWNHGITSQELIDAAEGLIDWVAKKPDLPDAEYHMWADADGNWKEGSDETMTEGERYDMYATEIEEASTKYQVSPVIFFDTNGDSNAYFTFTLDEGVGCRVATAENIDAGSFETKVSPDSSDGKQEVTIHGGDAFYVYTGWDYTNEEEHKDYFQVKNVKVKNLADYSAYILKINGKQDLGTVLGTNETAVVSFRVYWSSEPSLTIEKSTSDASGFYSNIVKNNDNYSLENAQYKIYTSEDGAKNRDESTVIRTLTTDSKGNTSTIKKVCKPGGSEATVELSEYIGKTLYIREYKASPGYQLDDTIYDVEITGTSHVCEVEDVPIYTTLSLNKSSIEETDSTLENIYFVLRYFRDADTSGTATKRWTLRTDIEGKTYLSNEEIDEDEPYVDDGSSSLWLGEDDVTGIIPLGSVEIFELDSAYSGNYISEGSPMNENFTADGMYYRLGVYNEDGSRKTDSNGNVAKKYTSESGLVNSGISNTGGALELSVESITITNTDGSTDHRAVMIDSDGDIVSDSESTKISLYAYDPTSTCYLTIHKIDKDTKESLAGATFNLIDSDGNVVKPTGDYANVITYLGEYNDAKTTDEGYMDDSGLITIPDSGYVTVDKLPEGNYTIKEVSAPAGYVPDTETHSTTLSSDSSEKDVLIDVENTQAAIGLGIEKKDAESGQKTPQGAASFDGATYQIKAAETITIRGTTYNSGDVVATLTLKYDSSKGSYYAETANDALGIGKYTITESSAPTGYQAASDVTVTVTDNGTGDGKLKVTIGSADTKTVDNNTIVEMTSEETILHFGLKIPKQDRERVDAGQSNASEPQGKATFKGVVYEIYNANSTSVWIDLNGGTNYTEYKSGGLITTITSTNDDGSISLPAVLPYGKYEVKETEPPEGYLNSGYDQVLPTDAFLNEIDSSKKDGEIYEATEQPNNEQVERFGFSIHKIDEETQIKDTPEGDADLKADFEVVNESDHSVQVDGKWYNTGDVVWTFTTDANGAYTSASNLLPYGKYLIREVKASTGYLGPEDVGTYARAEDGTYEIHFEYTEGTDKDGDVKDLGYTIEEPVIRSGLAVQKVDEELLAWLMASYPDYDWEGMTYAELHETLEALDIYWAQGDGELGLNDTSINKDTSTETTDIGNTLNLSDAEFTIYNKSAKAVLVDKNQDGTLDVATELFEPGEAVYVMYTDKYGYAETPLDLLPYGTYQVVETSSPEGYLGKSDVGVFSRSEDGTYYIGEESGNSVTIREEGKLYTKDDKDNYFGIYIEDPVVRGGVTVQKRDAEQKNSGETSGFGDTTPEGSALLSGTVYNIYNLSNHNVLVDKNGNGTYDEDELFKPYQLVYTITTDESGIASYVIRAQSSFFMQTAGRILHTRKILPALYITDADCSVLHPSSAQTSL